MSLEGFQQAFADLIASPERVRAGRDDAATVLAGYELTNRERRRLAAMLCDPGMSVNCTLFRVNRLIPVYAVLPRTCAALGERLLPQLDAFWSCGDEASVQYGREAARFARWLQRQIASGAMPGGLVEDTIDLELAIFEVRTSAREASSAHPEHRGQRVVRLKHDLRTVLDPPACADMLTLAARDELVLVEGTGDDLQLHRLRADPAPVHPGPRGAVGCDRAD